MIKDIIPPRKIVEISTSIRVLLIITEKLRLLRERTSPKAIAPRIKPAK
jgi:hypothetical protein